MEDTERERGRKRKKETKDLKGPDPDVSSTLYRGNYIHVEVWGGNCLKD